jgi:membrane peptidoglycan carboxypeptidase
LTEQYIKNRYFPSERRTLWQKLTEAVYASILEIQSGKEEILQKYLDGIYMGNGIYGANTAIEQYFQKSPKDLREEEILEILTRIHSPNL